MPSRLLSTSLAASCRTSKDLRDCSASSRPNPKNTSFDLRPSLAISPSSFNHHAVFHLSFLLMGGGSQPNMDTLNLYKELAEVASYSSASFLGPDGEDQPSSTPPSPSCSYGPPSDFVFLSLFFLPSSKSTSHHSIASPQVSTEEQQDDRSILSGGPPSFDGPPLHVIRVLLPRRAAQGCPQDDRRQEVHRGLGLGCWE